MIKKLLLFFVFTALSVFPQTGTYYDAINTSSSSFITDLESRIRSPYMKISYDQFDETNVTFFASRDTTAGKRVVTCVYSGENYLYTPPFAWIPFSREHTWCHSWMPTHPAESRQEYSDQHHLFPTNQNNANGIRSNHPLDNLTTISSTYLESKYGRNSSGDLAFEPRPIHKGDAARAILYMALKYDGINGYTWNFNWLQPKLAALSEGPQDLNTLISWHKQDPPGKWEVDRNNYIQSIQENRNPLVDHPEYVNYIDFNNLTKLSPVYSVEPTNYSSSFTSSYSSNQINLSWTDAPAGTQVPSGYLIIACDNDNYFIPLDGETYANDSNLSDGNAIVNISYGNPGYSFSDLIPNKRYYFTLISFNGSGTSINYKIDGTLPRTNALYNGSSVSEPTVQASTLNFTSVASNSFITNWTSGNGTSRIILAHTGSPVDADPADLNTYTANSVFGGGTQIGTGNYVVYSGSGTSSVLTGLNSLTTYYFKVYEFNGLGGTENYLTISPASGSQLTPAITQPTVQADAVVFSNVISDELTLSWTNGNGSSRIVLASSTSPVSSNPLDGVTYLDASSYGIGSEIGTGNYVIYKGSGNSVTVTGLVPTTTYYFAVYEFNGSGGLEDYLVTTPATGNQTTSAVTTHLMIAEVYAGGGNSGAVYTHDYVVLYNPTDSPVNLSGWSVQYASAGGTFGTSVSVLTSLSGSISSGGYFIIRESSNSSVGAALPYYDLSGSIGLGASAGKVALVHSTNAISGLSDPNLIDFVGYGVTASLYEGTGRAPAPSNSTSIRRKSLGTQDRDDNSVDFVVSTPGAGNPPLPIELQSFTATVKGRVVSLFWNTVSEKNNSHFELQRSANNEVDGSWTTVTTIQGSHLSNSLKEYRYIDSNLPSGKYWYRLKTVDTDGNSEYSNIIYADLILPAKYELTQNYPNPFNPETTIEYSLPYAGKVTLTVYDALGRKIKELVNTFSEAGYYKIAFNASSLSSGVYFYELIAGGYPGTKEFRSIKKAILIK